MGPGVVLEAKAAERIETILPLAAAGASTRCFASSRQPAARAQADGRLLRPPPSRPPTHGARAPPLSHEGGHLHSAPSPAVFVTF